jgi:hypothetical protein
VKTSGCPACAAVVDPGKDCGGHWRTGRAPLSRPGRRFGISLDVYDSGHLDEFNDYGLYEDGESGAAE